MNNKRNNYKILVLSELNKSAQHSLKNAVSLAKIINADIHFFHAKAPRDIVKNENQLSAHRSINEKYIGTEEKINSLISSFNKTYEVNISYSFAFGNLKNEIIKCIKELNPDVIVLGKFKPKFYNLTGIRIIDLVLKSHNGSILVSSESNTLEPNSTLNLGVLNRDDEFLNTNWIQNLMNYSSKPLKSFKVIKKLTSIKQLDLAENKSITEFVFEHSDVTFKNLIKYTSSSQLNLLCVNRNTSKNPYYKTITKSDINELSSHFNGPILLC
jgi:hypothetical protein